MGSVLQGPEPGEAHERVRSQRVPGQAWGQRGPRLVTLVNEECGLESEETSGQSRPIPLIKDLTNVIYVNRVLNRDHTLITINVYTGAKNKYSSLYLGEIFPANLVVKEDQENSCWERLHYCGCCGSLQVQR